ncbi:glycosyl hydrolase [Duganella sp. LX20W]|uniref:Glycosyl hydrolase n=1 Tax=Rugamonas brunnea TaxID=2758569 RepID=A0A7W2I9X5_9BURK|nr:YCF48-related protein [Rugamonas brunnea]MBA5635756.1 glycosyl hydrolase [Rugamonas brunnea]
MKHNLKFAALSLAAGALLACAQHASAAEGEGWPVTLRPAANVAHATQAGMLATAWAGARMVAVGAHGVVLLSDDQGKRWRQATRVPLDATLTGVSFADDKEGWAVGQAGVVLHTRDGGEQWEVQRSTPDQDRPLFAVHFFDRVNGVAVGLWSLVLTTSDGGQHWTARQLEVPPGAKRADLNLFGLFSGPGNALYAAAEKGYVLHSADKGASWHYLSTGYAGSFWTGVAMPDGALLVGGLRGALYRSADAGQSWTRIDTGSTASITGLARTGRERGVLGVGQDGLLLRSVDDGASFQATYRQDRLPLNAVLSNAGARPPLMSARGPVPAQGQ